MIDNKIDNKINREIDPKKVVVGMSGGVDSSVAAYILKNQGYEVIGVTMNIWPGEDREQNERRGGCCGLGDIEDARRVADTLDIEHYVLNFKESFKERVIDNFIDEYKSGRTPNPCIACNRFVKWQTLLNRAIPMGADYISTGHYAKVVRDKHTDRYTIAMSDGGHKDQSYALFNLTQEQLRRSLFPLGEYTKKQVRKMAVEAKLTVAKKPDSQEICFIPDNNYGKFLEEKLGDEVQPGDFVDISDNIIGKHSGIIYYTIGQRKNLGIAFGVPMYVKEIRPATNQVVLAKDEDLFVGGLEAGDLNFMAVDDISEPTRVFAKIRYSHQPTPATISVKNGILTCRFETPQRAVTPGQAAVFYNDSKNVICGGTILHHIAN
ncbi:MAG: tRNA 2-thiouridine(34) synthase MnmA [Defluviitaleaceae bacterium]|nr:tRNA 2-thiouridine(34) synthase MnmA [Defluviitaleaceae bacterium]